MPVTIAELGLSPGKGMIAMDMVDTLTVDADGLFGDRMYMFVEGAPHVNITYNKGEVAEPGQFTSLREDPRALAQIIPTPVSNGKLSLQRRGGRSALLVPRAEDVAENRIPVSVWGWRGEAVDQGNAAADWGSDIFGRPVRLVAVSSEAPRWVEDNPALGRVGFSDGYPVTVGSTRSLDLVNQELARADHPPISAKRPRLNILLDGLELPNQDELPEFAFPEDFVREIKISKDGLYLVLKRLKACSRCPVPDTNEDTGERVGSPVRKVLGKLGRSGIHGEFERYGTAPKLFWTQNFIVQLPDGMPPDAAIGIDRGAEVQVTYSNTTNWAPNR